MKRELEIRKINVPGLSRYKISEEGNITIAATGSAIPKAKDGNGQEYVFLSFQGRHRKRYSVQKLVQETFPHLRKPYEYLNQNVGMQKVGEFSPNEDEYGSRDGRYIKEIKEQMKLMGKITEYEKDPDPDQDEDANLE